MRAVDWDTVVTQAQFCWLMSRFSFTLEQALVFWSNLVGEPWEELEGQL